MKAILADEGLWDVVDQQAKPPKKPTTPVGATTQPSTEGEPTPSPPTVPTAAEVAYEDWKEKDLRAGRLIVNAVDDDVLEMIMDDNSGRRMWAALSHRFQNTSLATQLSKETAFMAMRMNPDQSVKDWVKDVRIAVNNLRDIGVQIEDRNKMMVLLQGVTEAYSSSREAFWQAVSVNKSTPSFEDAATMLEDVEDRSAIGMRTVEMSFMATGQKPSRPRRAATKNDICHYCAKNNHWAEDCKSSKAGLPRASREAVDKAKARAKEAKGGHKENPNSNTI